MAKAKAIGGYRPSARTQRRTGHISFDPEHEFYGAELEVAMSAPLGFLLDIQGFNDADNAERHELIQAWGDSVLISWNVEDASGNPVPANGEGLLRQEVGFVTAILGAWGEALAGVSAPLEVPSPGGSTSAGP